MSDGQKRITGMRAMPVSALVLFILVSAEQTRHSIRGAKDHSRAKSATFASPTGLPTLEYRVRP